MNVSVIKKETITLTTMRSSVQLFMKHNLVLVQDHEYGAPCEF